MSAALDRLKQQNEPEQSQQQLGSPETMELLTSILAAVEAQNTRIATLTEQQKKLAGFVKVMDEETTRRAERIIAATAKLEVRQLWSAAAAMCLVLLPVARGRRWPRRGRLRALRVRPVGRRSRGDVEGPRDAEVAPLAQEVITPREGKRAQRVRQPRQLDIRSAAAV